MGYIQDFERELRRKIDATQPYAVDSAEVEQLVAFVKEKVMESYWNGTKADGTKGTARTTKRFARGK